MKVFKRCLSPTILVILILSFSISVMASEKDNIKNKIQNIALKYNTEIILENDVNIKIEKSTPILNSENRIEISSLDELENLLIALENKPEEYSYYQEISEDNKMIKSYQNSYTFSEWAPFQYVNLGGPLLDIMTTKNCTVDYNYDFLNEKSYFHSSRNVSSWIGGAFTAGWTQTGSSVNFSTYKYYNDTMLVKVTGYGYIGIEYQGLPLSLKYPSETWNFSLRYKYD